MSPSVIALIDTHCHFDVEEFDHDRGDVAARAWAAGVGSIVIPGYIAEQWPKLFAVCAAITQPSLLPAPGLHPCYIQQHELAHLEQLEHLLKIQNNIVAVGEIGLDYFVPELKSAEFKEKQSVFFKAQLALAMRYQKPVILHVRKAHQEVIHILQDMKFKEGGIVHAYSGGIEEAKQYAKLGFRLGIGGPLTYEQSKRLRVVVSEMPLEALVLETDAPDMIPQPHRLSAVSRNQNRNSPEFLPSVAIALAALKNLPLSDVVAAMHRQSRAVLRLPDSELNKEPASELNKE
jgi:TatD DNase family protein